MLIVHAIAAFFSSQPVFAGAAGLALSGGLMFLLRSAPAAAIKRLQRLLTVTLLIEEREETFQFLTTWLADNKAVQRARTLMVAQSFDYQQQRWRWRLTLGQGWHILRFAGTWLFVHREIKEGGDLAKALGDARSQRLWIVSLGRSQVALRRLIDEAKANFYGDGLVNVHLFDCGWVRADCRRPRSLDTVFLPAEQKRRIVADMARFLGAREEYRARGVPWRRGYLFRGPPGTGKTTMIFALAGLHGRPIYVINLTSLSGDNQLLAAFNQIDVEGIVVIEDIDTVRATQDRSTAPVATPLGELAPPSQRGVTLSGLLNAIDGLAAREGRILFITSNHADKLDPALVRPGRIDLAEEIGPLGRDEALAMVAAFGAQAAILDGVEMPIPAADLQGRLLAAKDHEVIPFPQHDRAGIVTAAQRAH